MSLQHKYALPAEFRLRQYIIVRLLGYGGFGLTYLAEDTRLNRKVAIKELLPIDFAIREVDGTTVVVRSQEDKSNFEWARQRFVEEGQTLAGLHHPSILPVHEILEEHGTAYLVTAFIEGGNMEDWLREVRYPIESDLRSITHHILGALALVHKHGYLHRDVKPQNILMDRQNGLPILIDFGNARIASGARTSNLTSVLTKGYAPFEQYQTKGRQGAFTDLYSLGAVLYRAIKGVAPEDAADRWDDDNVESLHCHPPPGYSLGFLASVDKALQMRREDRWQNCREWEAALSVPDRHPPSCSPMLELMPPELREPPKLEAEPVETSPSAKVARADRPHRINRVLVFGLIAAILFLIIAAPVALTLLVSSNTSSTDVSPAANSASDAAKTDFGVLSATKAAPFLNSLGQEFVPVPGTKVLFCRWDTRVSDWQAFVKETADIVPWGIYGLDDKEVKWVFKKDMDWNHPGFEQTGKHPVVGVSWQDARRYCAWLSRKEGRNYRLPRDAEWSLAAGAQVYPWGNDFPPPAGAGNYCGSESRLSSDASGTTAWKIIEGYYDVFPRTSPVARFMENHYGLYDIGGNVWQWCEDEYKTSMNSAEAVKKIPGLKDEKAYDGTPYRVLRGGSWSNSDPLALRSTYHSGGYPETRNDNVGFRCVLVISGDRVK